MKNGELLSAASEKFDVLLTVDRNISYQQTIQNYDLALLIIEGKTTRLQDLEPLVPQVLETLDNIKQGTVERVCT